MKENLVTEDIQFSYNKDHTFLFPYIVCEKGEHLLITGSSGCGKTTLLHLIAGLLKPSSGCISINNRDITKLKNKDLDKHRGREIGIVFQSPLFIKSLTAKENLAMAPSINHLTVDQLYIGNLFEKLNISHCINSKVNYSVYL